MDNLVLITKDYTKDYVSIALSTKSERKSIVIGLEISQKVVADLPIISIDFEMLFQASRCVTSCQPY